MTRIKLISAETLKTGDTEPDFEAQLIKDNDAPKDLSTGSPTVSVKIKEVGGDTLTVDDDTGGNVSITDAANGKISYSWQAGDTDTAATYIGEVEVVDGSDTSTYPNRGYFRIYIEEDL